MKSNPIINFWRYHYRLLTGHIKYPDVKQITDDSEPAYRTFLRIVRYGKTGSRVSAHAILKVTFGVRKMSFIQKRVIPLLSIPFFAGFRGFVSKSFMVDEAQNMFRGCYEWESVEAAQEYIFSYPMSFMRKISVPGTLCYEIHKTGAE